MVTAALILGVSLCQVDGAQRLRTQLSNGATLIVERVPTLKACAIAIAFRADRCVEIPANHGWRHLLEHLAIKGKDGKLDRALESRGWMSTAWTYRDSMVFAAVGRKSGLDETIQAFGAIPKFRETTDAAIALETKIIAQEIAMQTPAQRFSNRCWAESFGKDGLDAWGSMESIRSATPSDLARVAIQQFDPRGMAIAIVGDIAVDTVSAAAKAAFESVAVSEWPIVDVSRQRSDNVSVPGGVTVDLPPAGSEDWIAKVGAALSLSETDSSNSSSLFSISFRTGMLAIFPKPQPDLPPAPRASRSIFVAWLDTIERNPIARATHSAQLAIVSPDLSIDRLRSAAGAVSGATFAEAAKEFLK